MQMKDRLSGARADVDDDLVVLQTGDPRGVGHEHQHRARLLRREGADVAERLDVPFRYDEEMRVCLRVDVADRDEPVVRVDMLTFAEELAEQTVVRQRRSPPR